MNLPEFSVRQVVLVNLFFLIAMLAGGIALLRMPIENFPDISFNTAVITTPWIGASADEVERLITTKIEDEVRDVDGIKELRSTSAPGVSSIAIAWDETLSETEHESALNELRAAVDRVADLPEDAEETIIRELSVNEVNPAIMVSVIDHADLGDLPLLELARDIERRIENLRGVDDVIIRGEQEREVRVLVDRDRAARFGLTVVEIAERLRRTNLNLPAGSFSGRAGEATLRATGDFRSLDEIRDSLVYEAPNGTDVRVRDVARVEEGLEKRRFIARFNGKPALVLFVMKTDQTDALQLSDTIRDFVGEHQARLPEGFSLEVTGDSSTWVRTRMSVLTGNLWSGILIVAVILFVTLGLRNAILTVIAIPFSFLAAFVLFPLFDMTINSLSIIGLLLVSGMLVDDAIIVLENIYRRIEEGEELRTAIVEGTRQVMWPVVAAVLTTVAAFLPLLLLPGTSGEFMSLLPKAVIICLAASLLECLVVLPAHYLDFGSRRSARDAADPSLSERIRAPIDRGIAWLRREYLRALDVVLANRGPFAAAILALFVFGMSAVSHVGIDMFPTDFDLFQVALETPTEYTLEQTSEVMARVEADLETLRPEHLSHVSTYVGNTIYGGNEQRTAPNVAVSYIWIRQTPEYRLEPQKAVNHVQAILDRHVAEYPEQIVELRAIKPRAGPPIGTPVAVRIRSDDYQRNKRIAVEMQAWLARQTGVSDIQDNLEEGPLEIRLVVDHQRAAQHNLHFEDLARALRGANDGLVATSYREPAADEDVDLRVMLAPEFRTDIDDLLQAEVRAPSGGMVKIGDVADIEVTRSFLQLSHFDAERSVTVYADVDAEQVTSLEVNQALAAAFADLRVREPEVQVTYGGEFEATAETFQGMFAILPLAFLAIYMILAAAFRSYLQPLVVCTAIPIGVIGTIFGVWALDYKISMYMLYAVIGMMGVAVNDALVMVAFVNESRDKGVPLLEAVRESGAARLRPILLTTVTTMGALAPMAFGLQGGSRTFGPFAAAIVFGLLFAMFGTLFVVPLTYTSLIRGQMRLRTAWDARRGRARAGLAAR